MMEFYTRIQSIIPNRRDNLDSLEHQLKFERDKIPVLNTEPSGQSGFVRI